MHFLISHFEIYSQECCNFEPKFFVTEQDSLNYVKWLHLDALPNLIPDHIIVLLNAAEPVLRYLDTFHSDMNET